MSVVVNDSDFTLHVGDVREVLATLPDESVHCVVTSPPYWGLRDYGTGSWDGGNEDCDHKAVVGKVGQASTLRSDGRAHTGPYDGEKTTETPYPYRDVCGKCGARRIDNQLGLEPTPDLYVQNMVEVFREVRRVLRRDGTCWLNIGDSYASGGGLGAQGETGQMADRSIVRSRRVGVVPGEGGNQAGARNRDGVPATHGLKPKDLVGIPWRLAFALQADGWYLRSDIIWAKPNPMPESVTDRPTKAHEYLFLLTRSPRYYFDNDAIREDHSPDGRRKTVHDHGTPNSHPNYDNVGNGNERWPNGGRNKRSVWEIATEPYPDAHFATFPQALVEPCVLAGTSERGCCPECGAPWERETETSQRHINHTAPRTPNGQTKRGWDAVSTKEVTTTGWRQTCDHGHEPIPCTVLDPFMGSGTTALVARRLGRKTIGVELSQEYAQLAATRLQQLSLLAEPA